MLERALGVLLLAVLSPANLTAQADITSLRERARGYVGCYELRLFDWGRSEGRDAAGSIPDRIMLTPTTLSPNDGRREAGVAALDLLIGPAPGFGSSDFVDERWSISSASDSVVLVWGDASTGVQAVLAMVGSSGSWRYTGRASAWMNASGAAPGGAPAAVLGRAAGRSVDCDR